MANRRKDKKKKQFADSQKRLRWSGALANLLLFLGSCVFAFAMGEGVCRLSDIANPHSNRPMGFEETRNTNPAGGSPYMPNTPLYFYYSSNLRGYLNGIDPKLGAIRIDGSINALGYRGKLYPMARTPGTTRIAYLGDSFALGIGVKDRDTSAVILEKSLNQGKSGFEVLNFGLISANTPMEEGVLTTYAQKFDPDIVTILYHLNDVDREADDHFIGRRSWGQEYGWPIREHSYFANALVGAVEKWVLHYKFIQHYRQGYEPDSQPWQAVRDSLLRMQALSRERHFHLLIAIHPILYHLDGGYPFTGLHEKVVAFCKQSGIDVLDLFSAFQGQKAEKLWVHPTDQHPNEIGHRIAGEAIAAYLKKSVLRASP